MEVKLSVPETSPGNRPTQVLNCAATLKRRSIKRLTGLKTFQQDKGVLFEILRNYFNPSLHQGLWPVVHADVWPGVAHRCEAVPEIVGEISTGNRISFQLPQFQRA